MSGVLVESLKGWQPGTAELRRRVDPWHAAAFAGLTGTELPVPGLGDDLPPLWHWFTLIDHPAQSAISSDGHPADGPFLPSIPHRRRMFAGGRLRLDAPIPIGADLVSQSSVAEANVKQGRSGELMFVTVRHELFADGRAVGVEEQDIVYRSEPSGDRPRAVPARSATPADRTDDWAGEWRLEVPADPVLLFRFSALTYNAHRIHYDRDYATQVEGYPGVVVHGPLLALLALELPRRYAPGRPVRSFKYRLARPAFAPARIVATGRPAGATIEVNVGARGFGPSLTGRIVLGPCI